MGFRIIACCLLVGLVGGCAVPGQDPAGGEVSLELHPLGSVVRQSIDVAGKRIPLRAGDWTVVGTEIKKGDARNLHVSYMLIKTADRRVGEAVEIFTNLALDGDGPRAAGAGWITHRNCVRDDMHFKEVRENVRLGKQDCWWVNHWRMNRTGAAAAEHWREAREFLEANKITAPLDMVAVSFRLADRRDYLTVNYFFNPELSGQTTTKDVYWSIRNWMTSEWHPTNVKTDQRKQQYIESLIAWGKGWRERVVRLSGID